MAKKNQTAAELNGEGATGSEQQPKERKPREVKVKHAKGSPHEILHTFIDQLTSTEADYLNRHVIKKALKDEHADGTSFEGELFNGVRSKLA